MKVVRDYRRCTVFLDRELRRALYQQARQDCRTPEQQIVWILRRELLRANNEDAGDAAQQVGATSTEGLVKDTMEATQC